VSDDGSEPTEYRPLGRSRRTGADYDALRSLPPRRRPSERQPRLEPDGSLRLSRTAAVRIAAALLFYNRNWTDDPTDPEAALPSASLVADEGRRAAELLDARIFPASVIADADDVWERGRPVGSKVHIRYPVKANPDDETWLAGVASRHNCELADHVMESDPMQRFAWLETPSDAQAFIEEVTNSGRWAAEIVW
jgi:hypothetical protein